MMIMIFERQRRPVDDCSPGRGGMAQNGRTRGGTFHGEMDRCRENQGWTTACSGMPERDGKNQEEDSPKQAGSLVRSPLLTSHKWRERTCIILAFGLQIPWRFFSGVSYVCFVLLRFSSLCFR